MMFAVAVSCPDNSDGVSVAAGCTCDDGSVVASTVSPFFTSTCTGNHACLLYGSMRTVCFAGL